LVPTEKILLTTSEKSTIAPLLWKKSFRHPYVDKRCLRLGSRDVHQTQIWVALKKVREPLTDREAEQNGWNVVPNINLIKRLMRTKTLRLSAINKHAAKAAESFVVYWLLIF